MQLGIIVTIRMKIRIPIMVNKLILFFIMTVFCKVKFPTFAKLFPQAPVGNIMSTKSKAI